MTVTLHQQGRWYCAVCRVCCTGCPPTDVEVRHTCGALMTRVASRLEVDDD